MKIRVSALAATTGDSAKGWHERRGWAGTNLVLRLAGLLGLGANRDMAQLSIIGTFSGTALFAFVAGSLWGLAGLSIAICMFGVIVVGSVYRTAGRGQVFDMCGGSRRYAAVFHFDGVTYRMLSPTLTITSPS